MARLLIRPGSEGQAGACAAPPVDAGTAARRAARRWALLVAVGWLLEFGLRVWFSRAQSVPLADPDESAYLIAARVLAGGPAADFSYSTLYQGGYPLLIAPVFWFTSNAVAVYHSVLVINAAISAALMPLAYVAGRRLGLNRPAAYAVAAVTALLPAGLFYAEYAMTDAIYPVLVLAWLLTVHSWLTARTVRGQYAAAAGSALLAGYAYAVHSRGTVIVLGYVAVGVLVAWRRLAPRRTVAAGALVLAATAGAGWLLDRYLSSTMYPEGTRNLSAQAASTLRSVHGAINVFEMAAGQLWRLVLDSWGLAGIGLFAALMRDRAAQVPGRPEDHGRTVRGPHGGHRRHGACRAARGPGPDLGLGALPRRPDRHVLPRRRRGAAARPAPVRPDLRGVHGGGDRAVRRDRERLRGFVPAHRELPDRVQLRRACRADPGLVPRQRLGGDGGGAGPARGVGGAGAGGPPGWPGAALGVPVSRVLRGLAVAGLAAVSLVAVTQMTSHISQAAEPAQAENTTGFVAATGLEPGDQIAVAFTVGINLPATDVPYFLWAPQAFEVSWTELEFFNPAQPPPAGVDVVETGLAGRAGRVGRLAGPPGRVADRGLQPGRGLGRLAEVLTWPAPGRLHIYPRGYPLG